MIRTDTAPAPSVAAAPLAGPVFRIERAERGIVQLVVDDPARKVNVLDEKALADLETALTELEGMVGLEGVVMRSGKAGSFIAGADVHAIGAVTDPEQVLTIVRRAHAAFGRLAALSCPTVVAIDGACLGGGAELALACDSRLATDEPHTQIGFPEVLLGIFPAFGGATRLPRLVGLSAALDLVLTGRTLDARRAERIGLVARTVPAAWLLEHALRRIGELRKRPAEKRRDSWRPRSFGARLLDGTPFGRALALQQARTMTRARTGGHYPAPLAAIDVIENGYGQLLERGLELEAQRVSQLVVGSVCKNLIRVFHLSEHAKKGPVVQDPTLQPQPVRSLALVGAGVMGGGIAELASRAGIEVRMRDIQPASLTRALKTVRDLIDERGRRRRLPAHERDGQLARIHPTLELAGMRRTDFAIEAVVEDLEIKRRVFAELEVRMRPDAVLATNTSSLSVSALGEGLKSPERLCGLHFFNPVHRMPLIEVVRGKKTSDLALLTAVTLARRLGKTPVVVGDAPGFVVNRILMPYLREAMHLLEEGFRLTDIDVAMRRFGMPMGPFEVLDEVGLDVAQRVAGILGREFPERMAPSPVLEKLVAAGRLGKKSRAGFYQHRGRKRKPDPRILVLIGATRRRSPPQAEVLAERMVLAMVAESVRCLEDGVIADPDMLDLAMIFGAGFPPFRGGPLRHADTIGLARVESRLTALRAERGERFKPAALLSRLVERGETFTRPTT